MATKQQDKAAAKAAQIKAQNAAKEVAESAEKTQTVQPTGDENAEQTIQKAEAENTNTDATANDDNGSVHSGEAAENLEAKNEGDSSPDTSPSGESESPYVKFKDEVYSKLNLTGEESEEMIASLNQCVAGHYSINSSIETATEEAKLFLASNTKPKEIDRNTWNISVIKALIEIDEIFWAKTLGEFDNDLSMIVDNLEEIFSFDPDPVEAAKTIHSQEIKGSEENSFGVFEKNKENFEGWFKCLLVLAHEKGENLANRDHYKHYFDNGIDVKTAFKTEYPYHL